MGALLHHLCEAVGDGQGGVDEPLHTVLQTRLGPVVQLGAWTVYALVPAHVREVVHLSLKLGLLLLYGDHLLKLGGFGLFRGAEMVKAVHESTERTDGAALSLECPSPPLPA